MDGDQADRFFTRERAEPFLHLAGGQSVTARADQVDADEIAVPGAVGVSFRDVQLAAGLFLVDRHQPPTAIGQRAENSEQARPRPIDNLDDPAVIGRSPGLIGGLDAQ